MSKRIKEIIVRYDDKQSFIYGNTLGEVVGELVRCKECRWWNYEMSGCKRNPSVVAWRDDDFCSYGEREGQ